MCLKPQAVPEQGKKSACFNVGQTWGLLTAPLSDIASLCSWFISERFTYPFLTAIIYITIYEINCFNQTSLSWRYDYLPGAWIFVNAMICKRASQVMGFVFGSFEGQTGWPCSKHGSQRQKLRRSSWNCKSCQNLCCWLFQLDRRGSFSCLSDTAFAHYTLTGDLSSNTMKGKHERCWLQHCLSLQMFAADLPECTPLKPFWHL